MRKIITLLAVSTLALVSSNVNLKEKIEVKQSKSLVTHKLVRVCILPYKKSYRGVKCSNKLVKCKKNRSCLLVLKNKILKGKVKIITKRQAISGPEFKDGISAFITASF